MKNKAAYAPITFEDIVRIMIMIVIVTNNYWDDTYNNSDNSQNNNDDDKINSSRNACSTNLK